MPLKPFTYEKKAVRSIVTPLATEVQLRQHIITQRKLYESRISRLLDKAQDFDTLLQEFTNVSQERTALAAELNEYKQERAQSQAAQQELRQTKQKMAQMAKACKQMQSQIASLKAELQERTYMRDNYKNLAAERKERISKLQTQIRNTAPSVELSNRNLDEVASLNRAR